MPLGVQILLRLDQFSNKTCCFKIGSQMYCFAYIELK